MGNHLSDEQCDERTEYLKKIFNLKFPNLNLGNRYGLTGYIDFISPEELGNNNVMMGFDNSSRQFVVFKAELEYPNGLKKKTFTTFFKRHTHNELLYHTCGHYGILLFNTEGGSTNDQIKMLYELLESGEYKLDKDKIFELNINFNLSNKVFFDEENYDEIQYPTLMRIGYSDDL